MAPFLAEMAAKAAGPGGELIFNEKDQALGAQVVELGPVNATIHKINECVNAADLQLLARMYQRIMEQLVA